MWQQNVLPIGMIEIQSCTFLSQPVMFTSRDDHTNIVSLLHVLNVLLLNSPLEWYWFVDWSTISSVSERATHTFTKDT